MSMYTGSAKVVNISFLLLRSISASTSGMKLSHCYGSEERLIVPMDPDPYYKVSKIFHKKINFRIF
jgi:hypothetical protein